MTAAADRPTVCLLHADVHPMARDCWSATVDFHFTHQHLDDASRRDAYQAAAERRMLDTLRSDQ